jgi:hypothetical protein
MVGVSDAPRRRTETSIRQPSRPPLGSRNDDIVDAPGLAGQLIDRWCAGPQPIDNVVRFRGPKDFKDYCVESELEGDSGWTWKML